MSLGFFLLFLFFVPLSNSGALTGGEMRHSSTQLGKVKAPGRVISKPDIVIDRGSKITVRKIYGNQKKLLKITVIVKNVNWTKSWTGKFWVRIRYNRGNDPAFGFRPLGTLASDSEKEIGGLGTLVRKPPLHTTRRISQVLVFYHEVDNIPNLLYRYKIEADYKNQVAETNESNNRFELAYRN